MSIPEKLEDVGVNQAVVKMDVDALMRESMIKLFGLLDDAGNPMKPYDDKYLEDAKTYTNLDPDKPGFSSLVRQFIFLEGKILGFLFQQFISMVKPIQAALELPALLAKPPELVEKIKEIIEGIKDLINDIIEFFTDTESWFMGLLLGPIMDINIPIPDLEISILGITIPIPGFDNLGMFDTDAFAENLTPKVKDLKDNIKDNRERLKDLSFKIDPDIAKYYESTIGLLESQKSQLLTIDQELNSEYWGKAYQIHSEVLLHKDRIIRDYLGDNTVDYEFKNREDELMQYGSFLINSLSGTTLLVDETYLEEFVGDETTLLTLADNILEILELEEKEIEDTVNNNNMESNEKMRNDFDNLDIKLNLYTKELLVIREKITIVHTDINKNNESTKTVEDAKRDMLLTADVTSVGGITTTIDELKTELSDSITELVTLSPASAWKETMVSLMIGVITAPVNLMISIITKAIEGILELVTDLPVPTFELIIEFFTDIIGLGDIETWEKVFAELLLDISGAPPEYMPVIERVVSFLPWLFVEIAIQFIAGIANPLPLPI